jgi:hypothetical protein
MNYSFTWHIFLEVANVSVEGNEAAYLGLLSVACLYKGQCAQGLQELDIG